MHDHVKSEEEGEQEILRKIEEGKKQFRKIGTNSC